MPIHDWTRVDAGIFHDFHQTWTIAIRNQLNSGVLPEDYFAMTDQVLGGPIPDVVTLTRHPLPNQSHWPSAAAVADVPPKVKLVQAAKPDVYASRANRIAIRHQLGEVVAVLEVVSPKNKNSRHALRAFVQKARDLIERGIHLLIVDLFPPSTRDPQGIHAAIWDEVSDEQFELPPDKPLTLVSYSAGVVKTAYVEPIAVGDPLADMPIFLDAEHYVDAPLESTYQSAWNVCPKPVRELLEE